MQSIKDRNGVDIHVGDMVYFLRGSLAGDGYYETCGEVIEVNPRKRMIRTDSNEREYLLWHEVWKEE